MNIYIQNIIVIVVVCHICIMLSPGSSSMKKTYRYLCGLAVLAVIAFPIRDVAAGFVQTIRSFRITENIYNNAGEEDLRLNGMAEEVALGWMQYISVVYGIPMDNMQMKVCEEKGAITEMRLYICGINARDRLQIETELQARMEAQISVWIWEMTEK